LTPVKQPEADNYLLLLITSFGVTVIFVRTFLELTGYPQIGDSTFHIAHMLWGGLLLIIAIAGVLIFANHWMYYVAALLGGIGTGLFIDEVGKFITQSNDYFYPLAFPIIYSFLIICVWLYFRVRRTAKRDTRTLLYHSFENLKEVLDDDLDASEHIELVQDLNVVMATAEDPSQRDLAAALMIFVSAREREALSTPNFLERFAARVRGIAISKPARRTFKIILILGFIIFAIGAFAKLVGLYSLISSAAPDLKSALSKFVVVSGKSQYVVSHPYLLIIHAVSFGAIGIFSLVTAILLTRTDERLGLRIGTIALVFGLTVANLLTFYFSQLYAIIDALGQLLLIGGAQLYRWRFYLHAIQLPEAHAQVAVGASTT